MNPNELDEMRQQMVLLKEKLNRQEIINEQLMHKSVERRLYRLGLNRKIKRVYMVLCIIFIPCFLVGTMGLPIWFGIATVAVIGASLVYHEAFMEHISTDDLNRLSMTQLSEKAIHLKKQGARWIWVSIPMLIAWMAAFFYVVLNRSDYETEGKYIVYGLSIGIIIGACLGTIIYKKQQRMIDDLRSEIQQ